MTNVKLTYPEDKLSALVSFLPSGKTKDKIEGFDRDFLLAEYDKEMASFRPDYKIPSKED